MITPVEFINGRKGQYRFVVKCYAGFMKVFEPIGHENEQYNADPARCLSTFKKGALQSVEFKAEDSHYFLTVFARQGKKIKVIDKEILENLKVGTINSLFNNTELYDLHVYQMNNAKSWADYAYRLNCPATIETV